MFAMRKLIEAMKEARQSHVEWAVTARTHGPDCWAVATAGDADWHERWVRVYDRVIRELKR